MNSQPNCTHMGWELSLMWDTTSLVANKINQKNMNLTKKNIVCSFYMSCFAKNTTPLKYSFQLLIDPSFFLHFLHTIPPHIEFAKNLSTNTHIEQQIRYRRIGVIGMPLLAAIVPYSRTNCQDDSQITMQQNIKKVKP